jgi:uncharacterized protein
LRARIQRTIAFVESVKEERYADADTKKVGMSWAPPGKVLVGKDYLLQIVMPNAYFHFTMACHPPPPWRRRREDGFPRSD